MPYEFTDQYNRESHDFYAEPRWCNDELFNHVKFVGQIHDPCCGSGRVLESAKVAGYTVTAADKVRRMYPFQDKEINFLEDTSVYDNIVCNPPYNLAELFFHHAYEHTRNSIAFLVRLAFLESQYRYKTIFSKFHPQQVLVFSTRPSMPPYGQPVGGGKTAYCWIIWSVSNSVPCPFTKLDWIFH